MVGAPTTSRARPGARSTRRSSRQVICGRRASGGRCVDVSLCSSPALDVLPRLHLRLRLRLRSHTRAPLSCVPGVRSAPTCVWHASRSVRKSRRICRRGRSVGSSCARRTWRSTKPRPSTSSSACSISPISTRAPRSCSRNTPTRSGSSRPRARSIYRLRGPMKCVTGSLLSTMPGMHSSRRRPVTPSVHLSRSRQHLLPHIMHPASLPRLLSLRTSTN